MSKASHQQDIFVGSSSLSLIFAIINLKTTRNLKLSTLNTDNSDFSPLWLEKINQIDLSFLKELGKHYDIRGLKSLDSFCSPVNERFSLCGHDIYLTQNPYTNFLSLLRNLNDLMDFSLIKEVTSLSETKFNEQIHAYVTDITSKVIQEGNESFDCRYQINKFFDLFSFEFFKGDSIKIKEFYKALQVSYSSHFSSKIADDELKYLLCSFLLPTYRLNTDALENALSAELLLYSAKKIRTKVLSQDWSNFEDFVDTDLQLGKVVDFNSSPLIIPSKYSVFLSLDFSIDIEHINSDLEEVFIYADTEFSSDDNPYIIFNFSPSKIQGHVLYQEHKATRPEFYYESVKKILDFVLKSHYPILSNLNIIDKVHLNGGRKKWLYNKDKYPENINSHFISPVRKLQACSLTSKTAQPKVNTFPYLRMGVMGYFLLD